MIVMVKHNCEKDCKNYGKKVKAPLDSKDNFRKGEEIAICQMCLAGDHYIKET